MLAEILHHLPHHQRNTILYEALLTQLKQGHSKQLGVLGCYCSGPQYGYLDYLLHVFLNLHCCLVMLQTKKAENSSQTPSLWAQRAALEPTSG